MVPDVLVTFTAPQWCSIETKSNLQEKLEIYLINIDGRLLELRKVVCLRPQNKYFRNLKKKSYAKFVRYPILKAREKKTTVHVHI